MNEYLTCFNATEAYVRVYPNASRESAGRLGSKLLKNVEIAQEIDDRLSEDAMRPAEVLKRIAEHARGDMGEYIGEGGDFDLAAMRRAKRTKLLHKFKRTVRSGVSPAGGEWEESRIEVELYDAQAALVQLGKHHKLFTDKIEHDGEINIKVNYGDDGTDDPAA